MGEANFTWIGDTLKKVFSPTLDKALTFLDDKLLPATSNAVERGNRRHREDAKERVPRAQSSQVRRADCPGHASRITGRKPRANYPSVTPSTQGLSMEPSLLQCHQKRDFPLPIHSRCGSPWLQTGVCPCAMLSTETAAPVGTLEIPISCVVPFIMVAHPGISASRPTRASLLRAIMLMVFMMYSLPSTRAVPLMMVMACARQEHTQAPHRHRPDSFRCSGCTAPLANCDSARPLRSHPEMA